MGKKVARKYNDFKNFTNEWLLLYNNKKYFEFIIDTKKCGLINPKYCFYMAMFIKKIKTQKIQFLEKSTIYVYNKYIFELLKIIFYIQKPVAPIKIIYNYDCDHDCDCNLCDNQKYKIYEIKIC